MKIQEVLYALVTVGFAIGALISFRKHLALLGAAMSLLVIGPAAFLIHGVFSTFNMESHAVLSVFQHATALFGVVLIIVFLVRYSKQTKNNEKEVQQAGSTVRS